MLDYRDPISTKPAGLHAPTLPDQLVKAHPIASHPLRHQLNNEVHARPPTPLGSPERVSYLAIHSGEQGAAADHACLIRLRALWHHATAGWREPLLAGLRPLFA